MRSVTMTRYCARPCLLSNRCSASRCAAERSSVSIGPPRVARAHSRSRGVAVRGEPCQSYVPRVLLAEPCLLLLQQAVDGRRPEARDPCRGYQVVLIQAAQVPDVAEEGLPVPEQRGLLAV